MKKLGISLVVVLVIFMAASLASLASTQDEEEVLLGDFQEAAENILGLLSLPRENEVTVDDTTYSGAGISSLIWNKNELGLYALSGKQVDINDPATIALARISNQPKLQYVTAACLYGHAVDWNGKGQEFKTKLKALYSGQQLTGTRSLIFLYPQEEEIENTYEWLKTTTLPQVESSVRPVVIEVNLLDPQDIRDQYEAQLLEDLGVEIKFTAPKGKGEVLAEMPYNIAAFYVVTGDEKTLLINNISRVEDGAARTKRIESLLADFSDLNKISDHDDFEGVKRPGGYIDENLGRYIESVLKSYFTEDLNYIGIFYD